VASEPDARAEARLDLALAAGVFACAAAVVAWRLGAASLFNGDDCTYAGFVREMQRSGDPWHLRFDGHIVHQRPPLYPWLLAISVKLWGASEWALRLPGALATAGTAAATFLLGRRLIGRAPAIVAGLLMPTLAMPFLYARAVTSDATLVFACTAAIALATRERWAWAGAALGVALMTKQVVGLLPIVALVPPIVARGRAGLPPARGVARAAIACALVAAPWHVLMLAWHGRAFLDGYLGFNVLHRSEALLLQKSSGPSYYLAVLWQKERWITLAFAAGAAVTVWRAWREPARRERDLLLLAWPLAVLVPFSLATTRIDYYVLPAYPALALLACAPLALVPRRAAAPIAAAAIGAALVTASFALHVPPRVHRADPFAELRALSQDAARLSPPGAPLLVVDELYLLPRWYADRPTTMLVTDEAAYARWRAIDPLRVADTIAYAPPDVLKARLRDTPRFVLLIHNTPGQRVPESMTLLRAGARYLLIGKGL
jgi:4-amino-4-deoxy-L-arabinose transferase-like glycosyltransferase